MSTARIVASVIFGLLTVGAGLMLLMLWNSVGEPGVEDERPHYANVPIASTLTGVAAGAATGVVTTLAGLPPWIIALVGILAGIVVGVGVRNLWRDHNYMSMSVRRQSGDPTPETTSDGDTSNSTGG